MPEAGGHQGEQPSLDPDDSRSARKSARPLLDRAASTVIALCNNPAHGLTCCFTLGVLFIRLVALVMVRMSDWLVFLNEAMWTRTDIGHIKACSRNSGQPGQAVDITARIERRQVLGRGLINEYRRAA